MFALCCALIDKYMTWLITAALLLGFFFPQVWLPLQPALYAILAVTLFVSGLQLNVTQARAQFKRPVRLGVDVLAQMLLVPLSCYVLMSVLDDKYVLAALLVVATPAATSSPAIVMLLGGCMATAIVVMLLTSLLAPLSMPLILSLAGTEMAIDFWSMCSTILMVVVLPLVLALLCRRCWPGLANRAKPYGNSVVTVLLMALCAVPLATQAEALRQHMHTLLWPFSLALLTMAVPFFLTALLSWKREAQERLAVMASAGFKNLALTVVLALEYLSPVGQLFCSLCVIIWVSQIIILKWLVPRLQRSAAVPTERLEPAS